MKEFDKFIEEASAKRCPQGQYWCYTDKKCKKIPHGYHLGRGGYIEPDEDGKKNGCNNGNGSSNSNGSSSDSSGSVNGSGNGGGANGG